MVLKCGQLDSSFLYREIVRKLVANVLVSITVSTKNSAKFMFVPKNNKKNSVGKSLQKQN